MQRDNKGTGFFFGEGQALDLHSILKDIAKQWLALAMLTISAVFTGYFIQTHEYHGRRRTQEHGSWRTGAQGV